MTKNLKLTFLFSFIISIITIAWHTLSNFFGGVGLNYVAILVLVASMLFIILFDNHTFARSKDLFFISCVFAFLEIIIYFPCEFGGCQDLNVATVFFNFQNVYAVLGLLFLVYIIFRFITETKNIRIGFVEFLLGNKSNEKEKRTKKAKEFSNGSLEEKPNATASEENIIITEDKSEE